MIRLSLTSTLFPYTTLFRSFRNYLVAIAVVVTFSGPTFLGIGAGSLANAASSQQVSTASLAGKSTTSVAFKPLWPCHIHGIALYTKNTNFYCPDVDWKQNGD